MAGYDEKEDKERIKSYGKRSKDTIIVTGNEILNIVEYEKGYEEHYFYYPTGERRVEIFRKEKRTEDGQEYEELVREGFIFKNICHGAYEMVKSLSFSKKELSARQAG